MTIGQALAGFAVVAAFLTILPGIDSALILRSALTQSKRHAYVTGFGIASGTFVWGAAAAVGAAALLAASELAFVVLKIVGAAYLVFLGVSMIVASFLVIPGVMLAMARVGEHAVDVEDRYHVEASSSGIGHEQIRLRSP